MKDLDIKTVNLPVKAVSGDGVFEGYLSRFNDEDLEGDIVAPGAFTQTLKEKGPKRPLLWQHTASEPVGILDAKQDDQGLFITGHLNLDVQRAREAHSLLKQGAISGLSQGFQVRDFQPRPSVGRILRNLNLWEGSLATFPCLPSAQVLSVRTAAPPPDPAMEARATTLRSLANLARNLRA